MLCPSEEYFGVLSQVVNTSYVLSTDHFWLVKRILQTFVCSLLIAAIVLLIKCCKACDVSLFGSKINV